MKGIPLIFTGFFRDLDVSINLTNLINDTPASWKIVETGNANNFVNFRNIGGILSRIQFRSSISRERYIQFYYNPDNISTITLTSANITELPAVKLQNASRLNFSYNQLRNFPDFTFIAENLQSLDLISNPLSISLRILWIRTVVHIEVLVSSSSPPILEILRDVNAPLFDIISLIRNLDYLSEIDKIV